MGTDVARLLSELLSSSFPVTQARLTLPSAVGVGPTLVMDKSAPVSATTACEALLRFHDDQAS